MSHIRSHIFHIFSTSSFLFKIFLHPILKKKKKKPLLLPISPHLLLQFLQPFPSLFASLSHPLLFTLALHFIIFSFLYFDSFSFHFILYKFDIISLIQSIFCFPHKNYEYSLSLSLLSFGGFLFFLITLIKVDGFFFFFINFFKMCFGILFF